MIFLNTLKEGDAYQEIYLVKSATMSVTVNNKKLLTILLQDKTGSMNAKKWDATAEDQEIFKPGKFVNISFDVTSYKEKLELRIRDARPVEVTKLDDYIPTSPIPKETLQKKLEAHLNNIKDKDIKTIIDELYSTYKEKILIYPAASNNHHAFASGLLYHTVSMLDVASFLIKHYSDVDSDIVLASVFLHDLGKIKELSGLLPIEYTAEGHLLGHLVIATNLINNVATKHHLEDNEKIIHIEHCVLSSHGKYEYGSPVLGATKEAIMVNFIDDLDAKMMMYDNNTKELNPGEFTNRLMTLDMRRLYKKKK
ncbi:MAG: HD domain-containing protein [Bacilli bacterium]|nr:HD domain-containing protein [Bacilli bacterium]